MADGAKASLGGVSESNDGPKPEDLTTLRAQAQRLQRETQSQSQVLLLLEEQESGSVERAQEVFELMDVNDDGQVSEDEFLRGMTALLTTALYGQDECVQFNIHPGSGVNKARAIGIDAENHAWVGFWNQSLLVRVDPATGDGVQTIQLDNSP